MIITNIIIILQMIMKQKGSKIFGVFHLLLLHFLYFACQWASHQSPSSGRDLILINYDRLLNYIDFGSYGFSPRKMCIESVHVFIFLKKFEALIRKVEFCFESRNTLEIPEITYGQETLVLLASLVWTPVGTEICQGSCEMIRALPQDVECRE